MLGGILPVEKLIVSLLVSTFITLVGVLKGHSHVRIFRQMNAVYILSHFLRPMLILLNRPLSLPSGHFPSYFPTENNINDNICSMYATFPADLTVTHVIFDEELFIMQLSPVSCSFFLLRSRHSSRYPVLEHSLHFLPVMLMMLIYWGKHTYGKGKCRSSSSCY